MAGAGPARGQGSLAWQSPQMTLQAWDSESSGRPWTRSSLPGPILDADQVDRAMGSLRLLTWKAGNMGRGPGD